LRFLTVDQAIVRFVQPDWQGLILIKHYKSGLHRQAAGTGVLDIVEDGSGGRLLLAPLTSTPAGLKQTELRE